MIKTYNEYVSRLLALSRLYRDNPAADHTFTAKEIQLIHRSAAAFDEIIYNIRMSQLHQTIANSQSAKKSLSS